MGRFSVEVQLTNDEDLVRLKDGTMRPDEVHRLTVRGVVDSGAVRLVIPEAVARQLALETSGSVKVRYADNRIAERATVQRVHLRFGDRAGVFSAIVEPARESILIGAIVLEELDLLIDCIAQRLIPRDPEKVFSEIE